MFKLNKNFCKKIFYYFVTNWSNEYKFPISIHIIDLSTFPDFFCFKNKKLYTKSINSYTKKYRFILYS